MATVETTLENVRFAVLDRPVCVLDPQLNAKNVRFLRGLDPKFFLYQAATDAAALNSASKDSSEYNYASVAMRLHYGMAMETFFATVCAVMQAPDCVFGWLCAYQPKELREMVRRITQGEPVKTLPPFRKPTWESIAAHLLKPVEEKRSPEEHVAMSKRFAKVWRHMAQEFSNSTNDREYNSIKHGFRITPVSSLSIEFQKEGKTFFKSEAPTGHTVPILERNDKNSFDYSFKQALFSLEPAACCAGLQLLAFSIHNAIAFARCISDDPETPHVLIPDGDAIFDAFDERIASITAITFGGTSTPNRSLSKEEILSVYDVDQSGQ